MSDEDPIKNFEKRMAKASRLPPRVLHISTPQEYGAYSRWSAYMRQIDLLIICGDFAKLPQEKQDAMKRNYARWEAGCIRWNELYARDGHGNPCMPRIASDVPLNSLTESVSGLARGSGEGEVYVPSGDCEVVEETAVEQPVAGEQQPNETKQPIMGGETVVEQQIAGEQQSGNPEQQDGMARSKYVSRLKKSVSFADIAAAAASRDFVYETATPSATPPSVALSRRAGTNVGYHPSDSHALLSRGYVWDRRTPLEIVGAAVEIVKAKKASKRQEAAVGQPFTAQDFSGVTYTENGHTYSQEDGSVRPHKYGGTLKQDMSICFASTTRRGCSCPACWHRHKFACLREAVAIIEAGGEAFLREWARNLMMNTSARIDLIPSSPHRPYSSTIGHQTASGASGETPPRAAATRGRGGLRMGDLPPRSSNLTPAAAAAIQEDDRLQREKAARKPGKRKQHSPLPQEVSKTWPGPVWRKKKTKHKLGPEVKVKAKDAEDDGDVSDFTDDEVTDA